RIVGVLVERGIEYLGIVMGIMRAGGAYVPMEVRHPKKRNQQVMKQSGARWVIAEEENVEELRGGEEEGGGEGGGLSVEDVWRGGEKESEDREERKKGGRNLAYVIYTSGSTGAPKGAMVEERGMMNHLWAKVRDLELGKEDVIGQTAPQVFDISVW